jgi:hypothetical protein
VSRILDMGWEPKYTSDEAVRKTTGELLKEIN